DASHARPPSRGARPPNGAAGVLTRGSQAGTVVAPDDTEAVREAIAAFATQWEETGLPDIELAPDVGRRISRTERVRELSELLHQLELSRHETPVDAHSPSQA